jgi:hypothetical protein
MFDPHVYFTSDSNRAWYHTIPNTTLFAPHVMCQCLCRQILNEWRSLDRHSDSLLSRLSFGGWIRNERGRAGMGGTKDVAPWRKIK